MAQASADIQVLVNRVTLIARFVAVLYPIDLGMLLDRLPESGWIVSRQLDPVGGGETINETPTKGNTKLRFDQSNKTLGVSGNNIDETLQGYQELMHLVNDPVQVGVDSDIHYVELQIIGRLESQRSPDEVFSAWWSAHSQVSDVGNFLASKMPSDSESMGQRGIRFASAGIDANRPNWAELTIYPDNIASNRRYYFNLIYRNVNSAVTEGVTESSVEILRSTIRRLENG